MRRAIVLVLLLLGVIPGGLELVEDLAHLALEGHLEEGACEDTCDASGCTPASHACSCCAPLRVATSEGCGSIPDAPDAGLLAWPPREGAERPSYQRSPTRPPNA